MESDSHCGCCVKSTPLTQSAAELDFSRGIHQSVINNDKSRCLKLISHANQLDIFGYSPLLYAVKLPDTAIAKLLLKNGAQANDRTRIGKVSCLHRACLTGNVEMIQLLLRSGADKEAVDADGRSISDVIAGLDAGRRDKVANLFI